MQVFYLLRIALSISGICVDKCLNGGKCMQKDICECPRGYFGLRCEFCKYKRHISENCVII